MFPAQIKPQPRLGLRVGAIVVVLQEHREHHQRRWDARVFGIPIWPQLSG